MVLGSSLVLLAGCDRSAPQPAQDATNASVIQPASTKTPMYSYEVINIWPHERDAFTQGLVFLNGTLLESTGLNGQSTLRKVELQTGKVLKQVEVPSQYFAEGLAALGGKLYQITWQNKKGFVYDLDSFHLEKEFAYDGEGWGLTTDGQWLILSDGTYQLRFLDPVIFKVKRTINILDHGQSVDRLNELEYVKGEIFANVWGTSYIVRIDPATGRVLGVIDFTGLLAPEDYRNNTDVMNGIAYDAEGDRLFVTGKRWPKLFEVRLKIKR